MEPCWYCNQRVKLVNKGEDGYPYRIDFGSVWVCIPCKAWVGCHKGSKMPMGSVANAELREARKAAHAVFDPMWRKKMERDSCEQHVARHAAYKWLAKQMNLPKEKTHIGMMDLDECLKVIRICTSSGKTKNDRPS